MTIEKVNHNGMIVPFTIVKRGAPGASCEAIGSVTRMYFGGATVGGLANQ